MAVSRYITNMLRIETLAMACMRRLVGLLKKQKKFKFISKIVNVNNFFMKPLSYSCN